ncbi:2791_t:CDS:1, partial [Acaulospora colombiana]
RYQDYGGGVAFPKSGQESNPPSDIERTMRRLTLNTRPAQETAAAQRQYERGRKISGGVLGLSGSTNQQEAYMNQRQGERSRSRPPNERARPISQDFSGRQLYMPTGGSNISGADPGLMDTSQPGVVPRPQSQYVNPNTMAGGDRPMNISQYM